MRIGTRFLLPWLAVACAASPPSSSPGTATGTGDGSAGPAETRAPMQQVGGEDAAAGCMAPRQILYVAPGCGDQAVPVCRAIQADTTTIGAVVCGCDGQTFVAGGATRPPFATRPYRHVGCCAGQTMAGVFTCPPGDAGVRDTPPGDACGEDAGFWCAYGSPGNRCSEVQWRPTCRGGTWRCEANGGYPGGIPSSQCSGFGPLPRDAGNSGG